MEQHLPTMHIPSVHGGRSIRIRSELKSENGEGSGSGGLHVRNQVILNDDKMLVFEDPYVDTVCAL